MEIALLLCQFTLHQPMLCNFELEFRIVSTHLFDLLHIQVNRSGRKARYIGYMVHFGGKQKVIQRTYGKAGILRRRNVERGMFVRIRHHSFARFQRGISLTYRQCCATKIIPYAIKRMTDRRHIPPTSILAERHVIW